MRVIIAAGGTGGHIYPGIAVANEIMRRSPGSKVRFVGTRRGLETRLVPDAGYKLMLVESSGLKNVGLAARLRGLWLIPKAMLAARNMISTFRPDVVIGAGGYVSGPVLLAASLSGVPTLVMESNALPGFTNRQLARFCTRAAIAFDAALPYFRGKGVVTGNPVRAEFFHIKPRRRDAADTTTNLLVFGGSQGAHAINVGMTEALPHLADLKDRLRITHQTGEKDFDETRRAYEAAGWTPEAADVRPYIDDIVQEFEAADLVICRAGATTSAELIASGRASVMVPLPTAADDHQRKNAEALQQIGASRMILQADLTGEHLASEIVRLVEDPARLSAMEQASREAGKTDAARATVDLIESMVKK